MRILPQFEVIRTFLEKQKERMLMLDGADKGSDGAWLTDREKRGIDFVAERANGGRIGLHEMLYDNTIAWLMTVGQTKLLPEWNLLCQKGVLSEDTTAAADIATFTTAVLPAVRRIFADNIAMDLVSVQPMAGPTANLYWINHRYTSAHIPDNIDALDRLDQKQGAETYTDSGEGSEIREIEAQLESKTITAETKKVATRWTIEAEQDFSSQWKLNLEAELMPELSNSIVREINRKLLAALLAGAKNSVDWSKTIPAGDVTTADKLAYYQTLWHAIQLANTKIIGEKYMPANWVVMNHNTFYYLERLNNFKADPNLGQAAMTHTRYVGILSPFYKVYVDPHFDDNKIMMGIRGTSWRDSVAYYAPYIPLFLSDKYIYGNDFTQFIRGAMTRYAYGVIPETKDQSPIKNGGIAVVNLTGS